MASLLAFLLGRYVIRSRTQRDLRMHALMAIVLVAGSLAILVGVALDFRLTTALLAFTLAARWPWD
jgi:hypothetical protein